jgi:hypothetical protein
MPSGCIYHRLAILVAFAFHSNYVHSFHTSNAVRRPLQRLLSTGNQDGDAARSVDESSIPPAAINIDDGGSDLTDRFKYKVRSRTVFISEDE